MFRLVGSGRAMARRGAPGAVRRRFGSASGSAGHSAREAATATATGAGLPPLRVEAASAQGFDELEVETPSTDYRHYRHMRLPNNLQVLLVSDSKCDRSAAALSVRVGSIFDPVEIPGLAHFCEHMLFLGTEKYPKEDEYSEYLAKNGGHSNAYTAETVTNYYFGVKPDALRGALDRFSQFFIAPLFTESATDRELRAVDSEHSKNVQEDGWRQSQLLRSAANPSHPLNHFMTGNSTTLRDTPLSKGVDVRASLLDFHKRYYSSNIMRLVIVGRESPEELASMAQEYFAAIEDRRATVAEDEEIGGATEAFPPDRLARTVYFLPVNDVRSAEFQFVMPGQRRLWRSKPSHYLSHLIGHEGEGSLLTALKRRGLATELMAGSALDEAGVHIFSVTVMLTEAGEKDVALVGDLLFSYVALLRAAGPNEPLWRELQRMCDLGFRFQSLADSVSTASGLAHGLQEHSPDVVMSAPARLWEYEPERIAELTHLLRCDRLRLILAGKAYANECDMEEKWYGTRYSDRPLDPSLRHRWEASNVFEDLALPRPNVFVPENLDLRPHVEQDLGSAPRRLSLTSAADVATAYFRQDTQFQLPKAICAFNIYCPFTAESIGNMVLTQLWCAALMEELNEFAYEARMAGLSYALRPTSFGMTLSVSGYNDKLPTLLDAVAKRMASLSEVSEGTFDIVFAVLERNLQNAAARSSPYQQAMMVGHCSLSHRAYDYAEQLSELRSFDGRAVLKALNRQLLDSCHIECLLQGNLTSKEADGIVQTFLDPIGVQRPLAELPTNGTAVMPPGWTLMERLGTNAEETNGAVVITLQAAEYSLSTYCLNALAGQILGQRFFDELRTKQQLGYIVSASSYSEQHSFVGMRLLVQSERPAMEVVGRVRSWLEDALLHLETEVDAAAFEQYKLALASHLLERPKSLREEFAHNFGELNSRFFDFGYRQTQAAHLEGLTVEDLRRFAKERLRGAPAICVAISPESSGSSASSNADVSVDAGKFDRSWTSADVAAFRSSSTTSWRWKPSAINRGEIAANPSSRL